MTLSHVHTKAAALFLAAGSALLLLTNSLDIYSNRFWYDELQSITHSTRPWSALVPSVLIYDAHGPIHYVLVKVWSCISHDVTFLLMSSSLATIAAMITIYMVGKNVFGKQSALAAAVIFAASPMAAYWSMYLRPYAWLMLFSVIFFYANLLLLTESGTRSIKLAFLIISGTLLAYTHVSGTFFLLTISAPILICIFLQRSSIRLWLVGHLVISILVVPLIVKSLSYKLGIAIVPGWSDVVRAIAMFVIGRHYDGNFIIFIISCVIMLAIILFGFLDRRPAVACVSGSIVLSFAVALAVSPFKPMWNAPRLFAYLTPFVAILIACCLIGIEGRSRALRWLARSSAAAAVALSLCGTMALYRWHDKPDDYRLSMQIVTGEMDDGDIVVTRTVRQAWSIRWYLAGASWQDSLYGKIHAGDYFKALRRWHLSPLRKIIDQYDLQPDTTKPNVFVASKLDTRSLENVSRIWLISRGVDEIDEMIKSMHLGPYAAKNYEGTDPIVVRITKGD